MIRLAIFSVVASVMLFAAPSLAEEKRLQTGDVIQILFPGEEAFDAPFQIDRNGALVLPEVGEIPVAGAILAQAREKTRQALALAYRNLDRLELRLKERRLPVTVLGYVKTPGPVDLVENATVQMALNAAGGLAQGAQLDRVQIRRDGETLTFDYKKYLDNGDLSLIPALRPLDVVFVPASPLIGNVQVEFDAVALAKTGDAAEDGEAVKIFGEVHRPGLYAMKPGATIVDLLMRAGGVTRYAAVEQIRVISSGAPEPFNLREYLDTGSVSLLPAIDAGDTIFVPQVIEQVRTGATTVYVMGEVFKPGAFETKGDATFFDILANAGGPNRFADTRQIRVLKAGGEVVAFDLQAYTEGLSRAKPPVIAAGDAILVPEKVDMNEKSWLKVSPDRAVRIIGAVRRAGRYEWSDEMSILDLIAHAGGPTAEADTGHVQVLSEGAKRTDAAKFDLKGFLENGGAVADLPSIKAGDTVVVPELPKDPIGHRSQWVRQASERSIYLFGQVGAPGRYAFNPDFSFLDILSAAQGPGAMADISQVRISHRGEGKPRVTTFNLALYFETGDESILPRVMPEDVIFIPSRNRSWLEKPKENTVRVLGAVAKPGRYAFDDSMTLLDLLAEAGGPNGKAHQEKIVVVNMAKGGPHARSFDLIEFAATGDFTRLPVVRAGDTVYVPNIEHSGWAQMRRGLNDAVSLLSFVKLIASF